MQSRYIEKPKEKEDKSPHKRSTIMMQLTSEKKNLGPDEQNEEENNLVD